MAEPSGPQVRLWPGPGGWWGWTFRNREGTEIEANRLFRSRRDAAEAAERAYPGFSARDPERKAGGGFPVPIGVLAVAGLGAAAVLVRRLRRRSIRVRRVGGG
jgi:hypothetical protein